MRLIGVSMNRIHLLYLLQNALAGVAALAASLLLALLCAASVFCAPSVRLWCGVVLCGAALALAALRSLPPSFNSVAVCALSAAAIILNLKHAFLKRV